MENTNGSIPECCICLMPIKYGIPEWQVLALECGHCFHRRCILHWNRHCPECRHGNAWMNAVNINCELHTTKYRRCFTFKVLRDDPITTLGVFIREITKIPSSKMMMRTIILKNNTINVQLDPPMPGETLQNYCSRRDTFGNRLMGFDAVYDITVHYDIKIPLSQKIDGDPLNYKFSNPRDVYIPLMINDESSDSNGDSSGAAYNTDMCDCVIL